MLNFNFYCKANVQRVNLELLGDNAVFQRITISVQEYFSSNHIMFSVQISAKQKISA